MGEVYRARDPRLGRDVALKVLAPWLADDDRFRRFELEARAAGALNHPNLLTIYDVGTHERQPFIVSELLEGETLRERLTHGPIPARKAIDLAVQIAAGIAAAHEKAIIHRDLKPENIFITGDERIKLLDFGLAKILSDDGAADDGPTLRFATEAGMVLGTPGYMSPEQVQGAQLDTRTDIFSFGVVLCEMLTGQAPFERDSRLATMNATLLDEPRFPRGFGPALERVIRHTLEKKPSQRFQSMRDVAFALETFSATTDAATAKRTREKRAAPRMPSFEKITVRRGFVMSARFARDGSIVYGAAWEDCPLEVFSGNAGEQERRLALPSADILSVAPTTGELAISLGRRFVTGWITTGTLARVPLAGGQPREIAEGIQEAEWGPDGKNLLLVRQASDVYTIEYPIGHRLYQSAHWISKVRFSPKGDLIAFVEHPIWGDDAGHVVVIDLGGKRRVQTQSWETVGGVAWTPKGDEVWTAGGTGDGTRPLLAFSMSGKERIVLPVPGELTIHDIAPNGDALISHESLVREVVAGKRGEPFRNLTWFDWSFPTGISNDGTRILFEEQRRRRGDQAIFVRGIDGSPAMYLRDGHAREFSPDDRWVLTRAQMNRGDLELLPLGAGEPRTVPCRGLEAVGWWYWFPDGKRVLLWGNAPGEPSRMFELAIDGDGTPRPVGPPHVVRPLAISPDGEHVAAADANQMLHLYAIARDESPRPVRGAKAGDQVIRWSGDALFVYQFARISTLIERIDLRTSERMPWQEIRPADTAGVLNIYPVYLAPDLETCAFSYRRILSELFLARNLIS
jgi:WD40 repeat protein